MGSLSLEPSFHIATIIIGIIIANTISPNPPTTMKRVLLAISNPNILKYSLSSCSSPPSIVNVQLFCTEVLLLSSNVKSTLCNPYVKGCSGMYITVYSLSEILLILISCVISLLSIFTNILDSFIVAPSDDTKEALIVGNGLLRVSVLVGDIFITWGCGNTIWSSGFGGFGACLDINISSEISIPIPAGI